MGDPSQPAALPPSDSGTSAFGGLNHLEGFLPLPSEGYNISKARTSSMADLPFLRKFPLCVCTVFVFFLLNVLAHILIFGSVQHLYASYIYVLCLPAPPPFFYCISFLRISLFSSHVHPYVLSICRAIYLDDDLFGGLYIFGGFLVHFYLLIRSCLFTLFFLFLRTLRSP